MKKYRFLALLIFIFAISLLVGRYDLSPSDILNIISKNSDNAISSGVFFNIRLPRVLLVALSGFALSTSGFVYQTIFRNPLAAPDILGVSSGASVGAIVAILFFKTSPLLIPIFAFIGGIFVVIISLNLAKIISGRHMTSLVLAGVIMGTLANSLIMIFKYLSDPERELATIEYWLMGSFNSSSWSDVLVSIPIIILAWSILFVLKRQIRVLSLGEEEATSMGINVRLIYLLSIIASTLLTAVVVATAGLVSWIGLVIPHLSRIISGDDYYDNFLQSGILGSCVLMVADLFARSLTAAEIPISIFTSLFGGFILIIMFAFRKLKLYD